MQSTARALSRTISGRAVPSALSTQATAPAAAFSASSSSAAASAEPATNEPRMSEQPAGPGRSFALPPEPAMPAFDGHVFRSGHAAGGVAPDGADWKKSLAVGVGAGPVGGVGSGTSEEAAFPVRAVYLDSQATTPMDPRVLDAMLPLLTEQYGNPHSRTHEFGWQTEEAVEEARENVASLIGAGAKEIVFTSGATESNNIALKGVGHFYAPKKKHIITTVTEHKCVLDSARKLQTEGFDVTYLPVKENGLVDMAELEAAIRPGETSLVSVMAVNNEIGVVQPLKEIGALCRKHKVFFHTDAAQAIGKIPLDVDEMNIDLMSISGHKLYGPKGIGALYVRRRPRVRLVAQMSGGGQERGFRSGTLPAPLIVGLGAAAKIAGEEMEADHAHVSRLYDKLLAGLEKSVPHIVLNGDADARYKGNLNVSFAYVEGESLLMALKDIALSSGSACTSASLEPSYVLRALGVEDELAHTSIRFGIGRFTTEAEVDAALAVIVNEVTRLREMSPLWEMVNEGIDLKSIQWTQEH